MKLRLPDVYDPPEPLEAASPFPIYHVDGTGTFVAVEGRVRRTSPGARHLEGRSVREVLEETVKMEVEVLAVEPRSKIWRRWTPSWSGWAP